MKRIVWCRQKHLKTEGDKNNSFAVNVQPASNEMEPLESQQNGTFPRSQQKRPEGTCRNAFYGPVPLLSTLCVL